MPVTEFHCSQMLLPDGSVRAGTFRFSSGQWHQCDVIAPLDRLAVGEYLSPLWPIDFHCHGIGRFDFSEVDTLDLAEVDSLLAQQGIDAIITLHLSRRYLQSFAALCRRFHAGARDGLYTHIGGFALEGPVLASSGGAPAAGVWAPTCGEWETIAACGEYGLVYVVMSPDAGEASSEFTGRAGLPPSTDWMAETLLDGGVRPALGHFLHDQPERSAAASRRLLAIGQRRQVEFISDHLFNDMPRAFRHAWRTADERRFRDDELRTHAPWDWSPGRLAQLLGPVPAALLEGARGGSIMLCLNFDGDHVDLEFSSRVVSLLGSGRLIGMTDRVEGGRFGGKQMTQRLDNSLLYEERGIVAAGTKTISQQLENLRRRGVREEAIWQMFAFNPARMIAGIPSVPETMPPSRGCFVTANGACHSFLTQVNASV